jgi:hypothetical protein
MKFSWRKGFTIAAIAISSLSVILNIIIQNLLNSFCLGSSCRSLYTFDDKYLLLLSFIISASAVLLAKGFLTDSDDLTDYLLGAFYVLLVPMANSLLYDYLESISYPYVWFPIALVVTVVPFILLSIRMKRVDQIKGNHK